MAAAAWAFAFAATSFYWALGGTVGLETVGPALTALAREPWFVLVGLWGAGVVKLAGGVIALRLAARGGHPFDRWLARFAAVGGVLAFLYGLASLVQHMLMLLGVIGIPAGAGVLAVRWHVVMWDPFWMLGGALFVLAARRQGEPVAR